ncbi:MAG TPA: hypothetical protein VGJ21_15260 [Terracidiphilus sp.]|jgi:hypothetical protein
MKRSAVFIVFISLVAFPAARSARAQAVESADEPGLHLRVGGMASGFEPDAGAGVTSLKPNGSSPWLIGAGVYTDLHLTHWIQLEAESRWLRFRQFGGEHEDNYLIGPRVPIYRIGHRGEIYGKALVGLGNMTFANDPGSWGHFTALAFGGSVDFRMTRKLTFRAVDFEYQDWPVWLPGQSLSPYGVSVGASYRVF